MKKNTLLIVLCGILGASCVRKQTAQALSEKQIAAVSTSAKNLDLPSEDLSPDDILRYINERPKATLKELWTRLKIDDFQITNQTYFEYKAEKFTFDIPRGEKIILLRIAAGPANDYAHRHLFFRQSKNNGWELFSYEDEPYMKYGIPADPYVEAVGDQYWVVIFSRGWFGTGIQEINKSWYDLGTMKAKRVLTESEKSQSVGGVSGTITSVSKKSEMKFVNGIPTVILAYQFGWNGTDDLELYRKRGQLVYVWNQQQRSFVYEKAKSSIAEKFESRYENKNDVGFNTSLRLYFSDLINVAKHGTSQQKAVLQKILTSFQNKYVLFRVTDKPLLQKLQRTLKENE